MTRNEEIADLIDELWASDAGGALTNRAARMIETLQRELISAERKLEHYSWSQGAVQGQA